MNRLIIVGSPRANGRSAALAELLFESCIDECPDDEVALAPVSTLQIDPCQGCDGCKALVEGSPREPRSDEADDEAPRRCVVDDDMADIYELVDAADELIVVSPVYFAGAPAQLKALLDRLQPYFWTDARKQSKRPATLHVVGEGGDPHGFEPLVGVVRSSLSCAGFALERVLDWVGRIDEDGEITAEAVEHPLAPPPGVDASAPGSTAQTRDDADVEPNQTRKPRLDLGSNGAKPSGKLSSKSDGGNKPSRNQGKRGGKQDAKRAHDKRSSGKNGG